MFCPNCGSEVSGKFCANCGSAVQQPQKPQQTYQPPKQTYTPPQQTYTPPQQTQNPIRQNQTPNQQNSAILPMSWHNFLVKIGLFLGALLNFGMAIYTFTGSQYGGDGAAKAVYAFYDNLKTYDIIYALGLIALAAYQIYARTRLVGFYADGPKHLKNVYLVCVLVQVVYIILVYIAYTSRIDIGFFDFLSEGVSGSIWVNFAVNMCMVAANSSYYQKRASMFTRT